MTAFENGKTLWADRSKAFGPRYATEMNTNWSTARVCRPNTEAWIQCIVLWRTVTLYDTLPLEPCDYWLISADACCRP